MGDFCSLLNSKQVVSNYSRWEHNDREDFKKRVVSLWLN